MLSLPHLIPFHLHCCKFAVAVTALASRSTPSSLMVDLILLYILVEPSIFATISKHLAISRRNIYIFLFISCVSASPRRRPSCSLSYSRICASEKSTSLTCTSFDGYKQACSNILYTYTTCKHHYKCLSLQLQIEIFTAAFEQCRFRLYKIESD